MSIVGIGTDICECSRIAEMITKHGASFIERVYSPAEIDYCSRFKLASQRYAGRWAAKEAILKALGTGWSKGIRWTDLEIVNEPGGQPKVKLHHAAAQFAQARGVESMLISISHSEQYAVAFAAAVGQANVD